MEESECGEKDACELARVLWQPPLPYPSTPRRRRGELKAGGVLTQGSSFLATAGLICETRFGVFEMAGLQSGQPYGVSVWRDEVAGGGAEEVEGVVKQRLKAEVGGDEKPGYSLCTTSECSVFSGTPNHAAAKLALSKTRTWILEPFIRVA